MVCTSGNIPHQENIKTTLCSKIAISNICLCTIQLVITLHSSGVNTYTLLDSLPEVQLRVNCLVEYMVFILQV